MTTAAQARHAPSELPYHYTELADICEVARPLELTITRTRTRTRATRSAAAVQQTPEEI